MTTASYGYNATAKTLHWLIATIMLGLIGLGFYMHNLPISPGKLKMYSWHKWAGVTVFLLATVRLAWRTLYPPPKLPSEMSKLLKMAAYYCHVSLYFLMFAIPLSGWLMSSAKGFKTVWFGVLPLPDLLHPNRQLGEALFNLHLTLNVILIMLLFAHVAAVLKHHIIDRDEVLSRMLPISIHHNHRRTKS